MESLLPGSAPVTSPGASAVTPPAALTVVPPPATAPAPPPPQNLSDARFFINRELSWLAFNERASDRLWVGGGAGASQAGAAVSAAGGVTALAPRCGRRGHWREALHLVSNFTRQPWP